MAFLSGAWDYVVPFLIILTILVFVHELGHYAVAKRCGVRVEIFSIGFGPELFGWTDKSGTRWKFSAVPLGGYVKMFGESDRDDEPEAPRLSDSDRAVSFHYKPLRARAAIVSAGPVANFVFAVAVLTGLFATAGEPFTPPVVGGVQAGSAAALGGIEAGDRFLSVAGRSIERFEEIQTIVRDNPDVALPIVVARGGAEVTLSVTPQAREDTDRFGNTHRIGFLGISGGARQFVRHGIVKSAARAVEETYDLSVATLSAIGQMIAGTRTADELGGPLRIAQMSGEVAQIGFVSVVWFLAVLSINLGLINLFPIPVLDGGHLLFYAAEAIRGKPLGPKAQEVGFRIGLALVVGLMVFATWNDLTHLKVFEFLKKLVT